MNILAANQNSLPLVGIVYLILIGLLTYFLLIKPSKKRKEEFDKMVTELKVGDEIITKSGVVGTIVELDDVYFTLVTAESTRIKFILNALSYIVQPVDGEEVESNSTEEPVEEKTEE